MQNISRKSFMLTSLTALAPLTSLVTHQRFYDAQSAV